MSAILATFSGNRGFVLVDVDARVARAQGHRAWRVARNGYVWAAAGGRGAKDYLHHLVVDARSGDLVDHINGNIFDCRRRNLRRCVRHENGANRTHLSNANTSGVTGVSWVRDAWEVRIKVLRRQVYLGRHRTIEAATAARRSGELKHFGAFAPVRA